MYRMRQRKFYTVYSMHELCNCTGWSTEDSSNEECTAGNDNVNVQDEEKKTSTVYSMNELCYCTGWSSVDRKEECTV